MVPSHRAYHPYAARIMLEKTLSLAVGTSAFMEYVVDLTLSTRKLEIHVHSIVWYQDNFSVKTVFKSQQFHTLSMSFDISRLFARIV